MSNKNKINCEKYNKNIEPKCENFEQCKWIKNYGCIDMKQEWNAIWNEKKNSWYYQKIEHSGSSIMRSKKPYNTGDINIGSKDWNAYWYNENNGRWLYENKISNKKYWNINSIEEENNINQDENITKTVEKNTNVNENIWNAFWSIKNNKWYYQKMENSGTDIIQYEQPNNIPNLEKGNKNWRAYWSNKNNKWIYISTINTKKLSWSYSISDWKDIKEEQISDDSKLIWNAFWSTKNNKWYYQKMENNGTNIIQYEKPNNIPKLEKGNKEWRAYWNNKNNKWIYISISDKNIWSWSIKNIKSEDVDKDWRHNYMYENAKVEQTSINRLNKKKAEEIVLPSSISKRNVSVQNINKTIEKIKNKSIDTIIGPHEIYKFKFNNRNIIFVGESHHNMNINNLQNNEIYFLDLFKLQLLRDNAQCYDLLVEVTPKHLPIFSDYSLSEEYYQSLSVNKNSIFKTSKISNTNFTSLEYWFKDDDLNICSSHFVNKDNKVLNKNYKGKCAFKNLRYHNIDLRFFNIEVKQKYEKLNNLNNYLRLIDIVVNLNNKYDVSDLISELKLRKVNIVRDGTIEQYCNIIWNLIRKEESKLDKSLIPNLNKFKKVFLQNNENLARSENIYQNIVGYMDYYAILRLFIKYDDDKLNRTDLYNPNYGITPAKCKNINKNENIVYYCGASHIILCYKIINEYLKKEPVFITTKKNSKNKIQLKDIETYNNRLLDLFGIFEL